MSPGVLSAWYVVFVGANATFVHRLLKPGFQHCWAFGWDAEADRWIVFNPGFDGIAVRALPHARFPELLAKLAAERATVVLARSMMQPSTRLRIPATCVTAIEALLGLACRRALTPWRLYRNLLACGAVPVMEQ